MIVRTLMTMCFMTAASVADAATPAQSCESNKNKEAGKYAYCRQKAEGKFAVTGDALARTTALDKCQTKYETKWPKLEAKAVAQGGACTTTGDQASILGFVDTHTDAVAAALAGGPLPDCPGDLATCQGDLGTCQTDLTTAQGDLTTCTGDLGTCQTDLTTAQGALTTCTADLATCDGDLTTCETALGTCDGDLTACETDLAVCEAAPQGQRLKTGQTTCWNAAGTVIACAGTGQDGELQLGLARAYVDNGDGTITDTRTGLMWERQSDNGTLNDKDNLYTWTNAVAVKIAGLNAGGGFAGYTGWRLPNRAELESLVDLGVVNPSVSPAFNTSCTGGCTLAACSCTRSSSYWSSSSYAGDPTFAWLVSFNDGFVSGDVKTATYAVRGVRGGS